MQLQTDPNNGATKAAVYTPGSTKLPVSASHQTIVWVFSVVVFLVLYQIKPLQKPIAWLGFIIILGILLQYSGTAINQFRNLGR